MFRELGQMKMYLLRYYVLEVMKRLKKSKNNTRKVHMLIIELTIFWEDIGMYISTMTVLVV